LGCNGIRVEDPADLAEALAKSLKLTGPTVLDVVVTRDPAKMLPGVDHRAANKPRIQVVAREVALPSRAEISRLSPPNRLPLLPGAEWRRWGQSR